MPGSFEPGIFPYVYRPEVENLATLDLHFGRVQRGNRVVELLTNLQSVYLLFHPSIIPNLISL